nr:GGDEF domain-containing protein [uncultured Pseudomonas sp.]
MQANQPPQQPELFALWREARDCRNRTRLGGIYYLLIWLFSDVPRQQIPLGLSLSLLFGLLFALRLAHRLPSADSLPALRRWLRRHWLLLHLTVCAWGLLQAWVLLRPDLRDARLIAIFGTVAFSTAIVFNFPMRKAPVHQAIALIHLPGLLVLALDWQEHRALLLAMLIYLSHLLLALARGNREYHANLAMEHELVLQRANLEWLSRTDSLTQLGNRYLFNSLFPKLVASCKRQGGPLALVLLDIDFFKQINDQHGHGMGDACLFAFAEHMRQVFRRDSDCLLRLGGEEFGVLMSGTSEEQARQLAEDFRQTLAENGLKIQGQHLPLTASLGVGYFTPGVDADAEAFFKRVDKALYRAKQEGRDRLVIASTTD